MSIVKFTETVFADKGKAGVLLPDEDGYYTYIVGALNSHNSAGEFYTAEGAIDLFNASSVLMRRVKNGALFSELGHPKRSPGQSLDDFYRRIISIEETNICGHFSEVWLDLDYGKNNPGCGSSDMIAMLAKVKPMGVKSKALEDSITNPKINTAFSIRGLTENEVRGGKTYRRLTSILTWDFVGENGITIANKSHSPGLESIAAESTIIRPRELSETLVDKDTLRRVLSETDGLVASESNRMLFNELLDNIEVRKTTNRLSKW